MNALSQTGYFKKEDIDRLAISTISKKALFAISKERKQEKSTGKNHSESKCDEVCVEQEPEEISTVGIETLNKPVETLAEKAARKKRVRELNKQRKKNRYA